MYVASICFTKMPYWFIHFFLYDNQVKGHPKFFVMDGVSISQFFGITSNFMLPRNYEIANVDKLNVYKIFYFSTGIPVPSLISIQEFWWTEVFIHMVSRLIRILRAKVERKKLLLWKIRAWKRHKPIFLILVSFLFPSSCLPRLSSLSTSCSPFSLFPFLIFILFFSSSFSLPDPRSCSFRVWRC